MRSWMAALGAVLVVAVAGFADEIKKKDGTILDGEIVSEDDDSVTIKHRLGEIRVPKKDVESVTRGDAISTDLEKLKAEFVGKLKELAEKAARDQKKDPERALRQLIEDVKAWSTRPRAAKKADDSGQDKPEKSDGKARTDYGRIAERIKKLISDTKGTELQRQKAVENYRNEVEGKPATIAIKVSDVKPGFGGRDGVMLVGVFVAGNIEMNFQFTSDEDIAQLEKIKRGSTITVDGFVHFNPGYDYPSLNDPKIRH